MQSMEDKELYAEWVKITEANMSDKYRATAYDWHGGQTSPLYSFASTGKVHNEDHRNSLIDEIEYDIKNPHTDAKEKKKLSDLKAHILKFKVG